MSNFSCFPQCFLTFLKPFSKQQILDNSKLEEFAGNNFKFDENGRNFFWQVDWCFRKTCTTDT